LDLQEKLKIRITGIVRQRVQVQPKQRRSTTAELMRVSGSTNSMPSSLHIFDEFNNGFRTCGVLHVHRMFGV